MNKFGVLGGFVVVALLTGAVAQATTSSNGPAVSLTLSQAIQLALTNNLTYRSAVADENIARGRVLAAGAGRRPTVSAGYQYIHNQYAGFFAFPQPGPSPTVQKVLVSPSDVNNLNATLQYALFTGGAVEAAIGQAAAGLAAAES